jgi:asparagine synthase (glutamine-hydrolysing)
VSGFAGILHADGAAVDPSVLRRMTEAMSHCGPDRQDVWLGEGVGLGHALLGWAPEPGTSEHQPRSLDGRVWVVADARVDGRADLLAELRARRRDLPPDTSDAELILHAYQAWGERCVEHLIGDFAFAIWDGPQRRLFCARDHFGVIPFYYARLGRGIVFGNVLRALRRHPAVSAALNERAIGDVLLFRWNQDTAATAFADILALPPAHALTWEAGTTIVRHYWESSAIHDEIRYARPEEHVERFTFLFDQAVADRLRADRAGTHLSGGMDSTSIAATARRVLASRGREFDLRAYTTTFDLFVAYEEPRYAAEAAAAIGIPLERVSGRDHVMRAPGRELAWVYPEPSVIPDQSPEYEIARRIASFARVQLTGFGGDPLFSAPVGWPSSATQWRERARHAALELRRGHLPRYGVRTALRSALGGGRPSVNPLPDWIEPGFARRTDLATRCREVQAAWHGVADHRVMVHPIWPAIFSASHPGANGLPVRAVFPFFDIRLAREVWATPVYPWRRDKRLLRSAMRGRLPARILRRPKTPFYLPNGRSHEGDPRYQLARLPETRRWRADLLDGAVGEYVDLDRARALNDSPEPRWTVSIFDMCFILSHWLRSEVADDHATERQTHVAASPAA